MMKKNFLISLLFLFLSLFASDESEKLNTQLFNVWTVEALEMKLMINNSIEYYVDANPEDSLKKIKQNDKIVIIESKKDPKKIFELRYGNRGKYTILDNEMVKWVLPKKLRGLIIEKEYYFINDDSYIRNVTDNYEKEFFENYFFWTNRDIYFSIGSKSSFDRAIYRLSSIGGSSIYPSLALSMRAGNDLLGYPNDSKGTLDFGLLGKIYEIGIQTPIFDIMPSFHTVIIEPEERKLQGGLGGYGKVSMFGSQIQLAFTDVSNNKLIRERIEDSLYVDYMSLSALWVKELFNKNLAKFGHLKVMAGLGYYEISHKTLKNDGLFEDRIIGRDGLPYENPSSSFLGLMIRSDLISLIKSDTNNLPLVHLFSQINGYNGDKSWMVGLAINYKRIGVDISYKRSVDNVDWAPEEALYASINYSR
jgi:hypothetical protein